MSALAVAALTSLLAPAVGTGAAPGSPAGEPASALERTYPLGPRLRSEPVRGEPAPRTSRERVTAASREGPAEDDDAVWIALLAVCGVLLVGALAVAGRTLRGLRRPQAARPPPVPTTVRRPEPPVVRRQRFAVDTGATDAGADIRDRAVGAVGAFGVRAVAVRALGLLATIALARLLAPRDFGVLAFGQTMSMVASLVMDVGLAAGLIRQQNEPRLEQLRSFFGFQLAITIAFAVVATVALWPFGRTGQLAAAMMWAVPVATVGASRLVVLERRLDYRSIAAADITAGIVYIVLALGLVVGGLGVWGVAVAHVARAGVQSSILVARTPRSGITPRLAWSPIRGLFAFGAKYQANHVLQIGREQMINLITLAVAGPIVLGLWSLAARIMLIPFLLFEALWRVSYPAMSRLVAAESDPSGDVARVLRLSMVATGLLLVGVAASAPLTIDVVFGSAWRPVGEMLPLAALGIMLSGPLSAASAGYLYAVDRPGRVLAATGTAAVTWAVLLPPLVIQLDVLAHGICWLVAGAAEALLLARAIRSAIGVRVLGAILPPVLIGCAVVVPSLLLTHDLDSSLPLAVAVAAVSTGVYASAVALARPAVARDLIALSLRALREANPRKGVTPSLSKT